MSSPSNPILYPLDAEDLLDYGLLSHPSYEGGSGGTQRIHKRRMNGSSGDAEYSHIPLDVDMDSPAGDEAFYKIPVFLISQEALVFVGFADDRAEFLWNEYATYMANSPEQVDVKHRPDDFLDFIMRRVDKEVDVWGEENDQEWRDCFDLYGMSEEFRESIMDPAFRYLRTSDSCYFWVTDTIESRFRALEEMQYASRWREAALRGESDLDDSSEAGSSHTEPGSTTESHE